MVTCILKSGTHKQSLQIDSDDDEEQENQNHLQVWEQYEELLLDAHDTMTENVKEHIKEAETEKEIAMVGYYLEQL